MLTYIPIIACTAALWFLITTIYAVSTTNSCSTWQIGEIAVCLLVLIYGVKHAYKSHP